MFISAVPVFNVNAGLLPMSRIELRKARTERIIFIGAERFFSARKCDLRAVNVLRDLLFDLGDGQSDGHTHSYSHRDLVDETIVVGANITKRWIELVGDAFFVAIVFCRVGRDVIPKIDGLFGCRFGRARGVRHRPG